MISKDLSFVKMILGICHDPTVAKDLSLAVIILLGFFQYDLAVPFRDLEIHSDLWVVIRHAVIVIARPERARDRS